MDYKNQNSILFKFKQFKFVFLFFLVLSSFSAVASYYNIGAFFKTQGTAIVNNYRSVGPGKTTPLACGAAGGSCPGAWGNLTISSGAASLASTDMPANVGVGDVFVYDCGSPGVPGTPDGSLGANDCTAFISARGGARAFTVKNSTGTSPSDFAAGTVWQLYRAYTSLNAAIQGTENASIAAINATVGNFDSGPRDITTGGTQGILNIACYADATDTTYVNLDGSGTSYTTSNTYYIRIFTPTASNEVGTSQRHQGYWNSGGYTLDVIGQALYVNTNSNIRFDGIKFRSTNLGNYEATLGIDAQAANSQVYITNNIIAATGTFGGNNNVLNIYTSNSASSHFYVYNNVVYTLNGAVYSGIYVGTGGASYVYNNSVYTPFAITSTISTDVVVTLKNNIGYLPASNPNSVYSTSASWGAGTGYNISSKSTATSGTGDIVNYTPSFLDPSNGDFRTPATDAGIADNGTDLSGDAGVAFSTDIKGTTRSAGSWDRGPFENGSLQIFRSVGTSTAILACGTTGGGCTLTGTLNITGNVATFGAAITNNNIGVGDVIQYDYNNSGTVNRVAFISGRFSSTSFKVQAADGTNPTATTANDSDWKIYRAYNRLVDGVSGVNENTGILLALRDFDSGTFQDLTSGTGKTWNIACYADGADSTQLSINGWTTSANNYLRIFTPNTSTEVGTSQRHYGKWSTSAYRLDMSSSANGGVIDISSKFVRLEGLQIKLTTGGGAYYPLSFCNINACTAGTTDYYFDSNIFWMAMSGSSGFESIVDLYQNPTNPNSTMYFTNNIVYSTGTTAPYGLGIADSIGAAYVYNNTVYNAVRGIWNDSNNTLAKNNIVQNTSGNAYDADTAFAAGSNYNISDDATKPGGANDITTATVAFVNTTNNDFQLSARDTVAFGTGLDLSTDSAYPINKDVHSLLRYTPWDIGASVPASVQNTYARFRSLQYNAGGSLAALTTGTSATLSVKNYVATFSSNFPTTIGIGDVLQYDTNLDNAIDTSDSLVFVKERISANKLWVEKKDGSVPTSVIGASGGANWGIYRAYTSLALALAGTENTSLDDDLENFDAFPKNLSTALEQLNIITYTGADTSAAASPTATITGWTTDATYYLRIASARGPSFYESGQNYRHQGVRDTNLYELSQTAANVNAPLVVNDDNIVIEGLQIRSAGNTANKHNISIANAAGVIGASGDIQIVGNILSNTWTANGHSAINATATANLPNTAKVRVWNNIMYSAGAGTAYLTGTGGLHYIYNNTAYGFATGYNVSAVAAANRAYLKNNIANGTSGNSYTCGGFCTSSNYNLADDATTTGGVNDIINTTLTYQSIAGNNYMLADTDAAAINGGTTASDANITFSTDILGSTRPQGASWDIGAYESYSSANGILLTTLTATSTNPSVFSVVASFSGDANANATATLYYCNNTDSSNCDPLTGTSVAMTRATGQFTVTVSGFVPPNDLGDVFNLKVVATDANGVTNSPLIGTVTLFDKIRYRSVGFGTTSALAVGTTNTMTLSGSIATFATALSENIGVGDAVLYDANNDGDISDAADDIAFITQRISSTQFLLKSKTGTPPTAITGGTDNDWKIFRAYTKLKLALAMTENASIQAANGNAAIYNFDNGATATDLVTNTHIRAIACYDDAVESDIGSGTTYSMAAYTVNSSYYVKIFTPYLATEVGRSQRHDGTFFGPGYTVYLDTGEYFDYNKDNGWIEGLRVFLFQNTDAFSYSNNNARLVSNYISYMGMGYVNGASGPNAMHQFTTDLTPKMVNNIITNFKMWDGTNWVGYALGTGYANAWIYNNTIVGAGEGGIVGWGGSSKIHLAKNNIVQGSVNSAYIVDPGNTDWSPSSSNNISDDTSIPSATSSQTSITDVAFMDKTDGDMRLSASDTRAKDNGTSMATDTTLAFAEDAFGYSRPSGSAWDIGATESGSSTINKSALMKITAVPDYDRGFQVAAYYVGDYDSDASAVLYYCNNTDSGGCSATTSLGAMTKRYGYYYAKITDLATPNDPMDTLNLRVIVSDPDGVTTTSYNSVTTDTSLTTTVKLDATTIYRSVGTNSAALEAPAGNNLTISGTTASFGSPIANTNIGVGDVIQYDKDGAGGVETLAFIRKRLTASTYEVQTSTGGAPVATTSSNANWNIYRAYTSLNGAATGAENGSINAGLRNFDAASQDLTAGGGKSWFIAAYADGDDTTPATFANTWVTGTNRRIKIFTPVSSTEVGASQRHTGTWASGGYKITGCDAIKINAATTLYAQIEGLRIDMNSTTNNCTGISTVTMGASDIRINHNIIRNSAASGTTQRGVFLQDLAGYVDRAYFWNNIVYGFSRATSACIYSYNEHFTAINNTVYNCNDGIIGDTSVSSLVFANNLIQNYTNYPYTQISSNGYTIVGNNIISGYPGYSGNGKATDIFNNSATVFNNTTSGSEDLLLAAGDATSKDAGLTSPLDLNNNLPIIVNDDIAGNARPQGAHWSVGAHDR